MTTFGYAEMRDWAEQSDDPRVKSMWERLSNCRSKIAKWCQAAEYAELRTKNLAAENAALRAEVERLRDAMQDIGLAITAHDASSGRARHDYDMVCAGGRLYDAVLDIYDSWKRGLDTQVLPAPPVEER